MTATSRHLMTGGVALLWCLCAMLGPSCAQESPSAAAPPSGPPPSSVLEMAIEVARADHPRIDAEACRAQIDAFARRYRQLAPAGAPAEQRAEAFVTLLFDELHFEVDSTLESPEALHVDSVLARRRGYCLSLSVVALAIAEQVSEPLHGVAMPNHFFVRFDDGDSRRNIELTRRGIEVDDDELRQSLGDFLLDDSLYLRNLEPAQLHAVLLHNRGFVALEQGRSDAALADFTRAAAELPGLPEVHRNLGVLYGERKQWKPAIAAFERALELHPGDVDALVNLALSRHATGDLPTALEEIKVALVLDPTRARAAELLAQWQLELGTGSSRDHMRSHGVRPLDDPPPDLRPGLRARYYRGTEFQDQLVERIDRGLDFDWGRSRPVSGVPRDRFSVRWDGWFKAPRSGDYTLFVVANDGVRFVFDGKVALENWRDVGYTSWTGSGDAHLLAGWHRLRIEYYDDSDNARLFAMISAEGDEYPLDLDQHLFHQRD